MEVKRVDKQIEKENPLEIISMFSILPIQQGDYEACWLELSLLFAVLASV